MTSLIPSTLVNGDSLDGPLFAELDGKEPAEQLELLNSQLALEHRIKEGAENLLNMGMAVRNRNISGTVIFLNRTRIILV